VIFLMYCPFQMDGPGELKKSKCTETWQDLEDMGWSRLYGVPRMECGRYDTDWVCTQAVQQ
jgi:hypothetical protein